MICNTLVRTELNGTKVYKDKKSFDTLDAAILAAKKQNAHEKTIQKLEAYKCTYCHKYHIGRNGKMVTEKEKTKYRRDLGIGIKVVGWIDLSKIKY